MAILSSEGFDAPSRVDRQSLTLGSVGDEESVKGDDDDDDAEGDGSAPECEEEDVNHDGLLDLVCEFDSHKVDFHVGDTEGILRGQTVDHNPIEGRDSVVIEDGDDEDDEEGDGDDD